MIVKLLDHMVDLLRAQFAGGIASPASQIVVGPIVDPQAASLPMIVLSLGALTLPKSARDTNASEPRPQPFSEELPINAAAPLGPYPLAKTPLKDSLLCKLILDQGTLDERQFLLVEGSDFTIDYLNAAIRFSSDISGGSSIVLRYAFVGVFSVQDFQETLLLDVYGTNSGVVEQWTALALAAVATSSADLIDAYNTTDPTHYSAGIFASTHHLTQLQPIGSVPVEAAHSLRWQTTFLTTGQLTLTKASDDGFSLIQKIRSPGRHADVPVDIDVGLE